MCVIAFLVYMDTSTGKMSPTFQWTCINLRSSIYTLSLGIELCDCRTPPANLAYNALTMSSLTNTIREETNWLATCIIILSLGWHWPLKEAHPLDPSPPTTRYWTRGAGGHPPGFCGEAALVGSDHVPSPFEPQAGNNSTSTRPPRPPFNVSQQRPIGPLLLFFFPPGNPLWPRR